MKHRKVSTMELQKFSPKTIEKIGYYVYIYSDPDTRIPFYVGKGKGNRVFAHLNDTSESDKTGKIEEIHKKGKEPLIELLVHGLSDEITSYKVESAVIDLIGKRNLTNMQSGFESKEYGRVNVADLQHRYEQEPLFIENITDNIMMIRINKNYNSGLAPMELYDATRGHWVVNKARADKAKYALSIYQGMVLEIYEIAGSWLEAGSTFHPNWVVDEKSPAKDRYEFVGRIVKDEVVRKRYVGKTVSGLFPKGNQNPIKYFYREEIGKID